MHDPAVELTFRQKVRRYFRTNLGAILPVAVATIVFAVARFVLVLPTDCPASPLDTSTAPNSVPDLGNPVFCGPAPLIRNAFEAAWRLPDTTAEALRLGVGSPPDPVRAGNLLASQTGIFKEAKARLLWLSSFGTKLAVCIAAIFGLLWVLAAEVEDYWFDKDWRLQGWAVTGLSALVACTVLSVAAIYLAVFAGLQRFVFSGLRGPPLFGGWFHAFSDTVLDFSETLMPAGHRLVAFSDTLVTGVTLALGLAVTMTLFQHPTQALRRTSEQRDPPYEEFLIRCFQRLMVCIYTGAALLVVCIGEIGARYSWPAALIGQPGVAVSADLDQAYKQLVDSFGQLAAQFQLGYGLLFTLFLAALFFPAWTILRRRAWELVRTVALPNNPHPSPADQDKWLTDHKLAFSGYQQVAQFIAILAPAGVGSLGTLLKLIGG